MEKHDYAFWKRKGHAANHSTITSEKFCAEHIQKLKGKNTIVSFGAGTPDILAWPKNTNFEEYEAKPYLEWWEKRGHVDWNLATAERRQLSKQQLKKHREMLKNGSKVFVIYFDRFIPIDGKPKYTIHKEKGKPNPREVTLAMLKNLDATDPAKYFRRWA